MYRTNDDLAVLGAKRRSPTLRFGIDGAATEIGPLKLHSTGYFKACIVKVRRYLTSNENTTFVKGANRLACRVT